MSTLRFTDGVEFDTHGELRAERRFDGWYVVGRGFLCPVDDEDAAGRLIERMNRHKHKH